MKVVAAGENCIIIPSRIGSTRLPRKAMLEIAGKPMVVQVYLRCVEAACGDVYVATDSEEIRDAIEKIGGNAVMTPSDLPSGTDRIYAALEKIEASGRRYGRILNVQGDVPNISAAIMAETLSLLAGGKCDIATSVTPVTSLEKAQKPSVVKAVLSFKNEREARALYFTRAACPYGEGLMYEHIGIYAYTRAALEKFVNLPQSLLEKRESLEQLRALENDMIIYAKVSDEAPISVDVEADLTEARKALEGR